MKDIISTFIDSERGGHFIAILFFLILGLCLKIFNPIRLKRATVRYIYSILYVTVVTLLVAEAISIQPVFLLKTSDKGLLWLFHIVLVIMALLLAINLIFTLFRASPDLRGKVVEFLRPEKKDIFNLLLFGIPPGIFTAVRILFLEERFTPVEFDVVWESIIIVPIIEEFAFRFLLPEIARDDKCRPGDYVVFSIVFFLLHIEATNLMPFFLSLYFYFVVNKTGKITHAIILHAVWNFFFYFFPYVHS